MARDTDRLHVRSLPSFFAVGYADASQQERRHSSQEWTPKSCAPKNVQIQLLLALLRDLSQQLLFAHLLSNKCVLSTGDICLHHHKNIYLPRHAQCKSLVQMITNDSGQHTEL